MTRGPISKFMEHHFRHFNAASARARPRPTSPPRRRRQDAGVAGRRHEHRRARALLAAMIRAGKVHAISCTGANLEEDLFNLLAYDEYEIIPDWRALSRGRRERALRPRLQPRDRHLHPRDGDAAHGEAVLDRWKKAGEDGERKFDAEFLSGLLRDGKMEEFYQIDPKDSWLLAAWERASRSTRRAGRTARPATCSRPACLRGGCPTTSA